MRKIGYALVDEQGSIVDRAADLPWSPAPPGNPLGRLASFDQVGQSVDGLTVVEHFETQAAHDDQVAGTPTTAFDGVRVVTDRHWTDIPLADAKARRIMEIKEEAQRRIIALTGASDIISCLTKQHNAQMRATKLTLAVALGGTWTPEQAAEAAALQGFSDLIEAIRAHSNALEADLLAQPTLSAVRSWADYGWPG